MKNRAVLYLRKSSENDERQVLSLDAQEEACRMKAQQENLTIVSVYREAKSAKVIGGRPLFDEAMRRFERGEADVIVAYDPNRLARNENDWHTVILKLRQNTIQMAHFCTFSFTKNASGYKQLNDHFTDAVYYSESLSEVIRRGNMQCFKNGRRPGGCPPVGYITVNKETLPHPQNFRKLQRLFAYYLSFRHTVKETKKYGDNVLGLRRDGGTKYTLSNYHKLLVNPFYAGILLPPRSAAADTLPSIGRHKAVITVEEHRRIKEHLRGRLTCGNRHPGEHHLFKFDFMKCACGGTIKAGYSRRKLLSGEVRRHEYYFCVACGMSWKADKPMRACAGHRRQAHPPRAALADMFLRDVIRPLRLAPEAAAYRRALAKQKDAQRTEQQEKTRATLTSRLTMIARQRQRAYEVLLDNCATKELFESKCAEWDREKAEIEQELRELDRDTAAIRREVAKTLNLAEHIEKMWVAGDFSRKREIVKLIALNLQVDTTTICADYNKPFGKLAETAKMKNGGGAGS